jgi:hypothetical protein
MCLALLKTFNRGRAVVPLIFFLTLTWRLILADFFAS